MSNITVRVNGVMNNTLTEEEFIGFAEQLFGKDKSLEDYIKLHNNDPRSKKNCTVVHKEVVTPAPKIKKTKQATPADYLSAAESNLSEVIGSPVTIEFADEN